MVFVECAPLKYHKVIDATFIIRMEGITRMIDDGYLTLNGEFTEEGLRLIYEVFGVTGAV